MDERLLQNASATAAWNTDLAGGMLDGLRTPTLVVDLTTLPSAAALIAAGLSIERAFRVPSPTVGGPDAWLALPSRFSSVVLSPLANDTMHRVYWTNPPGVGADGAWWSTYADILAGNPAYNLGFIAPPLSGAGSVLTVTAAGGTQSVPQVERSYLYTFIDQYGLESSPCLPSAVVAGAPDGTWQISGFPTAAPASPAGLRYPAPVKLRLYRTVTGQNTGAAFYQVADITLPWSGLYWDSTSDVLIVGGLTLPSASWAPPLSQLDGLTAMAGGMLVGFTGNTLHFCEPGRPHTWPAGYDIAQPYPIVALGLWNQTLMVLTKGYPSSGTGTSPSAFTLQAVAVAEPCIARGSVVTDLLGVYYASPNGLVMLSYFGMQNQTLSTITRDLWLTEFQAASIVACRHRSQYLACVADGTGFLIDYTEPRMGVVHVSVLGGVTCIWNDQFSGNAYLCSGERVYLWDDPAAGPLAWRWRSKRFSLPSPVNLGACQITLSPLVSQSPTVVAVPGALAGSSSAPGLTGPAATAFALPASANALFTLMINDQVIVYQAVLTEERPIFRLPSGFLAFDWQFEISARVPVYRVELATTMHELKKV